MKFGYSDVVIVIVAFLAVLWAILVPIKRESFGGSDWAASFWGPTVWDGWNTGFPAPRKAAPPEKTPVFYPVLDYPGKFN